MIESIRVHQDGSIEYNFDDSATDWEKKAIKDFGVEEKSEVSDAIEWAEDLDKMESDDMSHPEFERKWYRVRR